jgi:hypothetical protein
VLERGGLEPRGGRLGDRRRIEESRHGEDRDGLARCAQHGEVGQGAGGSHPARRSDIGHGLNGARRRLAAVFARELAL